jgi:hypothetical protein
MTEPQDSEHQESAILQLMVEFRQIWLAGNAARGAESAPLPVDSARRVGSRAVLLVLVAAAASVYLAGGILLRSNEIPFRFPWVSHRQPSAPAAAGNPLRSFLSSTMQPKGNSEQPSTMVSEPVGATVRTASSTHSASADESDRLVGYRVQVGAFNDLEYAQDLIDQLRSRNYSVAMVDAPAGPPHRVWIDGFFGRLDAEKLINRLRSDGFEAILVRP